MRLSRPEIGVDGFFLLLVRCPVFLRHSMFVAAMSLLLVSSATTAGAVVLWDQSNWNPNGEGSLNLSSTSACSQISGNTRLHTANDVHFSTAVNINSIKIYETHGNVEAATQAYLWIAPKTGALPTASSTDVNNAANIVPIAISYETVGTDQTVVVTASGLNITLPAGDYWVSLTPRHNRGSLFPWTIHRITSSAVVGDPTPSIEACTPNSNWIYVLAPAMYDYAIKIEGEMATPTLPSTWGALKSIYR